MTASGADFWWAVVELTVMPPTWDLELLREYERQAECNVDFFKSSSTNPPDTTAVVSATVIGDAARACAHAYRTGTAAYQYVARSRNAILWIAMLPRSATQTVAMEQIVRIARAQFAIIDRVAPR